MHVSSFSPILHLEFDTQGELALSMCRIQEFYESANHILFRKYFTLHTFLEQSMNEDGSITYFSDWSGFNMPANIVWDFRELFKDDLSPAERWILHFTEYYKARYVVANVRGDNATAQHEFVHAQYFIDTDYRTQVNHLIHETIDGSLYLRLFDTFDKMGYNRHVFYDEINAFVSCEEAWDCLGIEVPREITERFVALRKLHVPEVV